MVFALLAGVGLSQAIDFHAPGMTLDRAVKSLGEQIGERLEVAPQIQDEVVVIHVTEVDQEQVLARIASCVTGRWRTTQQGRILERTPEIERKIKEASVASRAAELQKHFDSLRALIDQEFNVDTAKSVRDQILAFEGDSTPGIYERLRTVANQAPMGRLAYKLLMSADVRELVDLEFAERRVFNLTPTKMQHGFGKEADAAFEDYVREQNIWAATVTGINAPGNTGISGNPLLAKSPADAPPTDLSLVVRKGEMSSLLFCNVERFGTGRGPSDVLFQVIVSEPRMVGVSYSQIKLPDDLTDEEKPLLEAVSTLFTRASAVPEGPVKDKLLKPLETDIPGFVTNVFFSRAYRDFDLVATVPDEALFSVVLSANSGLQREVFEKNLRDLALLEVSSEDGWVSIKPIDPYIASYSRSPRRALARFVQDIARDGMVTFETASKLNGTLRQPSLLAQMYALIEGLTYTPLLGGRDSWCLTRFFGLLSPAQRELFDSGQPIAFGSLNSSQKDAFRALAVLQEIDNREWASDRSFRVSGAPLEPTEALVDGIPLDATATQRLESGPVVMTYFKQGGDYVRGSLVPLEMVAYYERARVDSSIQPGDRLPDAYAIATKTTHIFRLTYPGDRWQEFMAIEQQIPVDAKPGPWTDLPANVVEQIKKSMGGG